ncbi:MAG: hypothetical protein ACR2JE_16980 [Acidobacteriaceae bacterium]
MAKTIWILNRNDLAESEVEADEVTSNNGTYVFWRNGKEYMFVPIANVSHITLKSRG